MTEFERFVGEQLAGYGDGLYDMAHDVLARIQERWIKMFGDLPEAFDEESFE